MGGYRFVEPEMSYFFPVGVPELFIEAYAPADYMETVNTTALRRYAKQEVMKFNKGVEIETQQNVLPLCTIPNVLRRARLVQAVTGAAAENVAHERGGMTFARMGGLLTVLRNTFGEPALSTPPEATAPIEIIGRFRTDPVELPWASRTASTPRRPGSFVTAPTCRPGVFLR